MEGTAIGIIILQKPEKAAQYMNLGSEDLISSLLWSHLRLLNPDVFLRRFINKSLGHEAIKEGELSYNNVTYGFWQKMAPPKERCPVNRDLYELMPELFPANSEIRPKEGRTEADCLFNLGDRDNRFSAVLMIEMKLNAKPSPGTSYDPDRNQIIRNVDVLWFFAEEHNLKRFYYTLFDNQHQQAREIKDLKNPLTLKRIIPDRNHSLYPAEEVAKSIGWISYPKVRDLLWEIKPMLKEKAETMACGDIILLLDDVIQRNTPRKTIFDFNR